MSNESLFNDILEQGVFALRALAAMNGHGFSEAVNKAKGLVDEAKSLNISYDDLISYIASKHDVSPSEVKDPFLETIEPYWRKPQPEGREG